MKGTIAILMLICQSAFISADDSVDIEFVKGKERTQLRIHLPEDIAKTDGAIAFLDTYFDFLDRNGDGQLSPTELKQLFPLPMPGHRDIQPKFAADQSISKPVFRKSFQEAGFRSIVSVALRTPSESTDANNVFTRALDRNGDGQLTRAELQATPKLLKRFDDNEDEAISIEEFFSQTKLRESPKNELPLPVIQPSTGTPIVAMRIVRKSTEVRSTVMSLAHFDCVMDPFEEDRDFFRETRSFYQSQFKAALGSKPGIAKSRLEQDPTLEGLVGLFDLADRDVDGTLTTAELDSAMKLIEGGASCRIMITVTDQGCDWFGRLDEDRNGKLNQRELSLATKFALRANHDSIAIVDLPQQYSIKAVRSPVGREFGSITLATRKSAPLAPLAETTKGPSWFRAMDRNGDGFVSAQEFLGTPERFRSLDTDRNGQISVAEAEQAH